MISIMLAYPVFFCPGGRWLKIHASSPVLSSPSFSPFLSYLSMQITDERIQNNGVFRNGSRILTSCPQELEASWKELYRRTGSTDFDHELASEKGAPRKMLCHQFHVSTFLHCSYPHLKCSCCQREFGGTH